MRPGDSRRKAVSLASLLTLVGASFVGALLTAPTAAASTSTR